MQTIDDQPIAATFFGEGKWLTDFITPEAIDVQELHAALTANILSLEERIAALHGWVASEVRYKKFVRGTLSIEGKSSVQEDLWNLPSITSRIKVGNCLAEGTKILTVNPHGEYEIKPIEELRQFHGYSAVSYNFTTGKVEVKPITDWFDNGEREILSVKMNNGEILNATPNHQIFRDGSQGAITTDLHDVTKGRGDIFMIRCLPPLRRHQPSSVRGHRFSYEHLWTVGHYLAEGHTEKTGKVVICNDDLQWRQKLWENLSTLGVPFSHTNKSYSNITTILCQKRGIRHDAIKGFKKELRTMGHIAPEKALTLPFLSLGRPQLRAIMDGYSAGDSYLPTRIKVHRKFTSRHRGQDWRTKEYYFLQHSTVSKQLADQLKLIHLILGRPLWSNIGNGHGAGKNPLTRYLLNEYRQASYKKATYYPNLGVLKPLSITDSKRARVYDIEVEDNHNFMLANGLLVHNCANKSFLLASLLRQELSSSQVYSVLGNLYNGKVGGHAWVQVRLGGQDYIVEPTREDIPVLVPAASAERYEAVHLFNDQEVYVIEGRTVMEPYTACFSTWLSDYLDLAYIEGRK